MFPKRKDSISPILGWMAGAMIHSGVFRKTVNNQDEVNNYLKSNNRSLEQEYELVQQKKSGLSVRLRNTVEYMYEELKED